MAWEWSHAPEAYANGYENLKRFSDEDLMVIFAEWKSTDRSFKQEIEEFNGEVKSMVEALGADYCHVGPEPQWQAHGWDQKGYDDGLQEAKLLLDQYGPSPLYDWIWARAEDHATCDNGGFRLWVCPQGCGCHTVSCDLPEEEEEAHG